jgi:integrase
MSPERIPMLPCATRLGRSISLYLRELEGKGLTEKYIHEQGRQLRLFRKFCQDRGVNAPSRISPELVREWILRFDNMSVTYQKIAEVILRTFLKFVENEAYHHVKVKLRGLPRMNVDWLTPNETEAVLGAPMTPVEAVLIRAGLLQGLRRVEVSRMTVHDAQIALQMRVLGVKGKGGRARPVPLHMGFAEALRAYLDRLLEADGAAPLIPITEDWAAELVARFSVRFGRRFTTHTLRRTFGRNLWLRGIPIETIAELMGHSSTDTTRLYLGLNISDMRKAIAEYGTKSELRILEKVPERRVGPPRPREKEDFVPGGFASGLPSSRLHGWPEPRS